MVAWLHGSEGLIGSLLVLSAASIIVSLILLPTILVKLPEDYFILPQRRYVPWARQNQLLRMLLFITKNLLGIMFILAGILMLVLPGQGILTIIAGLVLMEFPGKYHVERWFITRPAVLPAINWIRAKAGKAPFVMINDIDSKY